MMTSVQAKILLSRWQDIRERIFSLEIKIAVLNKLNKLSEEDYYLDLRNTSESRLLLLIEQLALLPPDRWNNFVKEQPLTLLSFLYDRVLYVEQHLNHLGQGELIAWDSNEDLLTWGLVKLWNERDIGDYP
jgi:hypothetical protein